MTDHEYANELAKIADAYEAGVISREEFRRQMAGLRDRRIGSREQESQPPKLTSERASLH
jgi:hypothetical protein